LEIGGRGGRVEAKEGQEPKRMRVEGGLEGLETWRAGGLEGLEA
jgi:hypothetical protein